jgi:hypothetical protein
MTAPRPDIGLPIEQRHTRRGGGGGRGNRDKPMLSNPPPRKRQHHGEASSPASNQLPLSCCTRCRGMGPCSRRRGSRWCTFPPLKLGPRKWLPQSAARGARLRPPGPSPLVLHLRSPLTGWTRCTINWRRSMSSPPHN